MQTAVPVGDGAMAAILGLEIDDVEALIAASSGTLDVANDNGVGQVVVSGARSAVEAIAVSAKERGAKRVMPLPVSAPFHCRLMRPAAERMAAALAEAPMRAPSVPVVANVSARALREVAAVREALIAQVCDRVRWRETMAFFAEVGTARVVEAGSGRVLAGLAKRGVPGATIHNLETADDVRALAAELAG
jgi:[acyl-carrier-protein] S-malonyltransferase